MSLPRQRMHESTKVRAARKQRYHFGVDFEASGSTDEREIYDRFIAPAARALKARIGDPRGKTFLDLELPPGVERSEILHDVAGLPLVRLVTVWTWKNLGTEDEPNVQFVHAGRIDCMYEAA